MKYRSYNERGYVESATLDDDFLQQHAAHGIGEIEQVDDTVNAMFNAYDMHTKLYEKIWRAKDYLGLWEINHAICIDCAYSAEASALVQWYWHTWGLMNSTDIDVDSFKSIALANTNDIVTETDINNAFNLLGI